ncbi:MAG: 3-oxoacyl-ACP reductase FabG [Acidobacteria bacterium]|nr:3-oxoacyl-ACP reductase FabG [Acidobacteriota bacterium]
MQNYLDLTGKVALVTGASSGIGAATAIALAAQGASVAINYNRNEAGANQVQQTITAAGGKAIVIQADVTKTADIKTMIERTSTELGPIDILVNNAGSLVERMKLLELTEERWDDIMNLNLKSVFLVTQAVAPAMIERKTGSIINLTSIAGRNGGGPGAFAYATAKGGLITLTKGIAKELAAYGIRVNSVAPGVIDTPFHETFSTAAMIEAFIKTIPMGRLGTSEETAKVILFLASDAAGYVCGETIEVNGGQLML